MLKDIRSRQYLQTMNSYGHSLMFHCCAIALAAMKKETEALDAFTEAKNADPDNRLAYYYYRITEKRIANPKISEIIYFDEEI